VGSLNRLLVGTAAVVVLGLSGCTTNTPGVATTQASSVPPGTTSASNVSSTRPREVKLSGVNPCELLSQNQLQGFAVDKPPRAGKDTTFQSATCDFLSGATNTSLRVTPVMTVGIDHFAPGKVTGNVRPRVVQGFPAYENHIDGASAGNDFCSVTVDVANGQVLDTMFGEQSSKQPMTKEAVCQKANELADAAMTTLLAR
jgi:uncharacterized protein with FMN-binding domain